MHLGIYKKALDLLHQSIELNPKNWYPLYFEGLTHILSAKPQMSEKAIHSLLDLETNAAFMAEKAF